MEEVLSRRVRGSDLGFRIISAAAVGKMGAGAKNGGGRAYQETAVVTWERLLSDPGSIYPSVHLSIHPPIIHLSIHPLIQQIH